MIRKAMTGAICFWHFQNVLLVLTNLCEPHVTSLHNLIFRIHSHSIDPL